MESEDVLLSSRNLKSYSNFENHNWIGKYYKLHKYLSLLLVLKEVVGLQDHSNSH